MLLDTSVLRGVVDDCLPGASDAAMIRFSVPVCDGVSQAGVRRACPLLRIVHRTVLPSSTTAPSLESREWKVQGPALPRVVLPMSMGLAGCPGGAC